MDSKIKRDNKMSIRNALKMVVPETFDPTDQKFHGHLNKHEFAGFCELTGVPAPSHGCYQGYVSTGVDMEDGQLKMSMTTISHGYDACESIVTPIDRGTENKAEGWFKGWFKDWK
jgi:hypothetical protein